MTEQHETEQYLTEKEVCQLLKVSRTTLWRMENGGLFPKHIHPWKTRSKRWLASQVLAHMRQAA